MNRTIYIAALLPIGLSCVVAGCRLTDTDFDPAPPLRNTGASDADIGAAAGAPAVPDAGDSVPCVGADCCVGPEDCGESELCVGGRCSPQECTGTDETAAGCIVPPVCTSGECGGDDTEDDVPVSLTASCEDQVQNGQEAGIDCGRSCPERCPTESSCSENLDCTSFRCVNNLCALASCQDEVRNQDESDTDCGGSCEQRCVAAQSCGADVDCAPGLFCPALTKICTDVSCQDSALNGNEILVDCGGGECPGCPVGTQCQTSADCDSGSCGLDGSCQAPTCDDEVKNQDETAVDCGGSCDQSCAVGEACNEAQDCDEGVCGAGGCSAGVDLCCQPARCDDEVQNGNEPAVDCGSEESCGLCSDGSPCSNPAQCQSGLCNGTCQPRPPCDDGQVTGNEGDVDCGGSDLECARCLDGRSCNVDSDCSSGLCDSGTCVSCDDGLTNNSESDVDCGGTDGCVTCSDGLQCNDNSDCTSGTCDPALGRCVSCNDGEQNGDETDIDCGGSCGDCAPGQGCSVGADCSAGACVGGTCCGGDTGDCTRCAQVLATDTTCESLTSSVDRVNCNGMLSCLSNNQPICATLGSPGCSGTTNVCDTNSFGGSGGVGVQRAQAVLLDAGCRLTP